MLTKHAATIPQYGGVDIDQRLVPIVSRSTYGITDEFARRQIHVDAFECVSKLTIDGVRHLAMTKIELQD